MDERIRRDAEAREIEQIMRTAEAQGHDPQRVARALDYRAPGLLGAQPAAETKGRPVLARLFGGDHARRR